MWAQDLVNTPSGEVAGRVRGRKDLADGQGREGQCWIASEESQARWRLGVGQGSGADRLVKVTCAPLGAKGKVALIGKGVVFGSGGLSLKTASSMETMGPTCPLPRR
jgi:leucyl aminopeptidase